MKKLKKIWHENSVLVVLFLIIITCFVAISVVVITYFVGVGDSDTKKHGDRIVEKDKHPFDENMKNEIVNKIKENEKVIDVNIDLPVLTIFVGIKYDSKVSLEDAKSTTLDVLEYFSDDLKGYYDISFNIYADSTEKTEGYNIWGSHNVSGTGGIVW